MIEHSKPTLGRDELYALRKVIVTNYPAEGWAVRRFENSLSDYIGAKGAVATSTGTLALYLALLCLSIKPKDEVIVPSYTCRSVLNAVLYIGAKPVVCDVNIADYNISFTDAKIRITQKTKAIIIPHMFGCPAEIDKFRDLGIPIIEDCAHSIGAEYKGKKVGSWGDLSIFSFEGTKYITTGEGGMVLANSKHLLEKLKKLKEPESFDYKIKYTYRMTNLQAALGIVQLLKLKSFIMKRRRIAKIYTQAFSNLNIELPKEPSEGLHIFHRYMVKISGNINQFMQCCYKKRIKVKQPVKPYPLHRYLKLSNNNFPNTTLIMKSAVSIPIYPLLADREVQLITDTLRTVLTKIK
ncbi:MAG: DegT/DnrJ/EryC1/StrS aminotransferase family protein [Candidatus Omnitrophota bacterium]|nr:DegT/DnrJ/EryC1/StrS aminotransferase family protein [Candidatus Omnitrophota bacterium]MBU1928370.1 DegT/DnrJ/EryC1/StrS aminotransferase family protein [Candidatus Omnitrophota bacterium]MBU2035171.1 DegT/DnrJ/EryC1/StrS aminotransferase family protein [Candidatus Omnitrophota bacterium]MBU2221058.1 DegT/DnrJ/EryC1/StrS aminotransferase family protein [Candidatus Omnitrophota bacterium]MBU2258075.1 DegT/DnrJ/EryC1/StrS aminotransferase family protein [Candidatus Omnitrophota bacterium]